jgi:hypothetical protein
MAKHDDATYIATDPFFGDEAELTCRTVTIRTAAKEHTCFTLDGNKDHVIAKGERYRHERARVDGSFWGEYRLCLDCIDRHINDGADDDEEAA